MQKLEHFLSEGHRSEKHVLFWVQNITVPFGIGHPHLHIKPSLYECRRAQGSQFFKQNWIVSICSILIVIFLISVSSAVGAGAGGWEVSGVNIYSLYEFFKQNQNILISLRLIEFWCFGLPAALGRGQVGGGVSGGICGHVGCPYMHAHACACTHTCIHV